MPDSPSPDTGFEDTVADIATWVTETLAEFNANERSDDEPPVELTHLYVTGSRGEGTMNDGDWDLVLGLSPEDLDFHIYLRHAKNDCPVANDIETLTEKSESAQPTANKMARFGGYTHFYNALADDFMPVE